MFLFYWSQCSPGKRSMTLFCEAGHEKRHYESNDPTEADLEGRVFGLWTEMWGSEKMSSQTCLNVCSPTRVWVGKQFDTSNNRTHPIEDPVATISTRASAEKPFHLYQYLQMSLFQPHLLLSIPVWRADVLIHSPILLHMYCICITPLRTRSVLSPVRVYF